MSLWVIVTIAAAAVQTVRFSLQKGVKGLGLSTGGSTFSRFLFAAPLAAAGSAALIWASGQPMPGLDARFWAFAVAGGLSQIIATLCTVALFSERSFAVGIAFTKTETVQVALVSGLVLGDHISAFGFAAILVGFIGVLLLSVPPRSLEGKRGSIFNRATLLGLLAGAFFGASAIGYRGATLEIASADPLLRAALALACVTTFQTLVMIPWLSWREPGEVARVVRNWRATALIGLTGMLGSLGWFTAFTLENAAYVRSVGQIDLIFSFLISLLVFHEKVRKGELAGIALLAAGIVMIISQS
ncbi:DMT family transporter [Solirhodobacter olei]|uniref:DMT family transporter n=1 Tax=Solirhodobacter olei TaxID=2493082 RepID=UPI000FD9CC9D|nr:DMT family transporter [Solirhodobacter olei]